MQPTNGNGDLNEHDNENDEKEANNGDAADNDNAEGAGIDSREEREQRTTEAPSSQSDTAGTEKTADGNGTTTDIDPIADANVTERKLFIGGLQPRATDADLEEYFGQFGQIERVLVKMDPVTKRSRGFGFVTFMDKATLSKVLEKDEHTILGRRVDCKQADGRPPANSKMGGKMAGSANRKVCR